VVENRKSCPTSLHFGVKSLVGRSVVTDVGLLDVRVVVNWLRVLLDVMLLTALTDLVEGSSDKVHETREVSL